MTTFERATLVVTRVAETLAGGLKRDSRRAWFRALRHELARVESRVCNEPAAPAVRLADLDSGDCE